LNLLARGAVMVMRGWTPLDTTTRRLVLLLPTLTAAAVEAGGVAMGLRVEVIDEARAGAAAVAVVVVGTTAAAVMVVVVRAEIKSHSRGESRSAAGAVAGIVRR
jgi:hypothetical protein